MRWPRHPDQREGRRRGQFVLLPGQRHDPRNASLLAAVEFEALIADKACDSNELRVQFQARGVTGVIPPKSNRVEVIEYDSEMSKWRCLVENFFRKLKPFRRLAMRFREVRRQLRRDDLMR